ncbi:cytochrome P450 [Astrocystis sublimbata]|nr:cytochrome P450 [Astrocystis sublimbata]
MLRLPDVVTNVTLYAAFTAVLYCTAIAVYRVYFHPLRGYPGPILAKVTDAYAGFHAMMMHLHLTSWEDHQKYGRVIRHGPNKLLFNSVAALKDIYMNDRLSKSHVYMTTFQALPENAWSTMDKTFHSSERKIIGAVLREPFLSQFQPALLREIDVLLGVILTSCQDLGKPPLDMTDKFQFLTLDIIGQLIFGLPHRIQTRTKNRFLAFGLAIINYHNNVLIQFPFLSKSLLVSLMHLFTARSQQKNLDSIQKTIRWRIRQPLNAAYDMYYAVTKKMGPGLFDTGQPNTIWSEAAMLYSAGGRTSSTTMSALCFYLSRYPDCYAKLASEIRSTFTNGTDICNGSMLASCVYLRACIDETLRIAPPGVGSLWRELAHNDTATNGPLLIDGHVIQPGTQVGVCTYVIHHNEDYFPEPFVFKPDRWLGVDRRSLQSQAFAPFSLGSRSCGGKQLAYTEISLVIANILWYFDFEHPEGRLGNVGGGTPGRRGNRGRVDEYQLYDIFSSAHKGPMLLFRTRANYYTELQEVPACE